MCTQWRKFFAPRLELNSNSPAILPVVWSLYKLTHAGAETIACCITGKGVSNIFTCAHIEMHVVSRERLVWQVVTQTQHLLKCCAISERYFMIYRIYRVFRVYRPFSVSGSMGGAPHKPRSLYGLIFELKILSYNKCSHRGSFLTRYWTVLQTQI
jgi:hypothetical protein